MALPQKYQCAIIVLMLVLGLVLVVPIIQAEAPTVPFSIFMTNMMKNDKGIAIVMDIRGADAEAARKIMQCGTNLAGSQLFVGKERSHYACDNSGCLTAEMGSSKQRTVPYADLENEIAGKTVFYVKEGKPDNRFTTIRSTITLDETFNGNCQITVK
jgi:uncharacterized heparinase superfamily protein